MNTDWLFCRVRDRIGQTVCGNGIPESDQRSADAVYKTDFDDSEWQTVSLPHAVHRIASDTDTVWYRKRFVLTRGADRHLFLRFEGLLGRAEIYLNGMLLRGDARADVPCVIDITDHIRNAPAVNALAVCVCGARSDELRLENVGIGSSVVLYEKGPVRFVQDGIALQTERVNGTWQLVFDAATENRAYSWENAEQAHTVLVSLEEPEGTCIGSCTTVLADLPVSDGKKNAHGTIAVQSIQEWTPQIPTRYTVSLKLLGASGGILDTESFAVGFRTFAVSESGAFLLNGAPIRCRGFCLPHTAESLAALEPSVYMHWVKEWKSLGANACRCKGNTAPQALLAACDALGMLVFEEYRYGTDGADPSDALALLLSGRGAHPSAVMLTLCAGDTPIMSETEAMLLDKMVRTVRYTDTGRAVGVIPSHEQMLRHPRMPRVDAVGKMSFAYTERTHTCPAPAVYAASLSLSENGGALSEELLGEALRVVRDPHISGYFLDMDVRGYAAAEVLLSESPAVCLLSPWIGKEGQMTEVSAFCNGRRAALTVNSHSYGIAVGDKNGICRWSVPFERGAVCVQTSRGRQTAHDERRTPSAERRLILMPQFLSEDGKVIPNGEDTVCIVLCMTDEEGVIIEHETVSFEAELLGCGVFCQRDADGDPRTWIQGVTERGRARLYVKCSGGDALGILVKGTNGTLFGMDLPVAVWEQERRMLSAVPHRSIDQIAITETCWTQRDRAEQMLSDPAVRYRTVVPDCDGIFPFFVRGWCGFRFEITVPDTIWDEKRGGLCHIRLQRICAAHAVVYVGDDCILDRPLQEQTLSFSFPCKPNTAYGICVLLQGKGGENGIGGGIVWEIEEP